MTSSKPIPYGRQDISEADIAQVVEVLNSDFLTQGPMISRFETSVATACKATHGVAVSNGTAALHLGAMALDLGPGDWLWTTPITFVASANCARYCGASVDFVDIDPHTANLCPKKLEDKLEKAEKEGRLPKVVVPVHFAGQSCAMDEIHSLSQKYGFRIMEDASHALGGTYLGEPIGSGRWSDMVVHSFHPVKIVTTGEGGMITTKSDELAELARTLRTHGITRDPTQMVGESEGPWYYQQIELGYNYRMTDIQAALGVSQMGRLREFSDRRHALASLYQNALSDLPVRTLQQDPRGQSGWHLFMIRLDLDKISRTRRQVFEGLRARGILVNVHYIPVHLQPDYQKLGFSAGMFPEAERYYEECITLPMFPAMKDEDVYRVRNALVEAMQG